METRKSMNSLRSLPSVDALLQLPETTTWVGEYGRPLTVQAVRHALAEARQMHSSGTPIPGEGELLDLVSQALQSWTANSLQPVINATGVILHTNLGRAPLSQAALSAIQQAGGGYSNLEYDLDKGQRGSRLVHAEAILKHLTGAEAALVVNNNAAAVLLILTTLAKRRKVVIARSQLVEIGGGFRVPDIMKQSGAHLIEVGTTNRVHLSDYETALEQNPALILRAHRSNFRLQGFTHDPELGEISQLARTAGIPLVDDLGSGSLLDTSRFGLEHEPTVQESLAGGADLVCFSGDKLLGGPQAGIILGRDELVARLKKHPLARAVRADKLCLAALNATLLHYLKNDAESQIPIWRMIAASTDEIHQRAAEWATLFSNADMVIGESTIGGGSLPGETLPTWLLVLHVPSPTRYLARLRQARPAVIARLEDNRIVLDPRTVLPEQEGQLLEVLNTTLTH
jgi:L-seryl-tRNA(Ser) seleniumtransferase